ncbi:hypothetical protein P43SY_009387 [Pythium insidiosum]|uniref:DUF268 domain-containing protein n=1 Tax=Pythium insidiosum TaxID=114742 RepID=A0AAD5Q2G6_PYTIN|nr:hypothetical protein P43SY_009387 [Pythium insidiosum]
MGSASRWCRSASWLALATLAIAILQSAAQADTWTLHDPGFPVAVTVRPFADDQWLPSDADASADVLRIPSSVLNVSVSIPVLANVSDAEVTITLFRRHRVNARESFEVLANTQVQLARSYRIDVGTKAEEMVLRVYVEAHIGHHVASDHTLRAFFVRSLDLSPSEPTRIKCEPANDRVKPELRIATFPPTNMPADLCSAYTMDGRIPVRKRYFDDQTDLDRTYEARSRDFIDDLVTRAKARETLYYGEADEYLFAALDEYPIRGKHVLIVGSTFPWYESVCIAMEAASCTTIDYNKLRYDHPKIATFTLAEFQTLAPRKQFDVILSISSLEHDGLGRYGDPLDPDGDFKAMRELLQYVNVDQAANPTRLFLAVPVGPDALIWNSQRIYGPLRLPLLLEAWNIVDSFGFAKGDFSAPFSVSHQPVFVLEPLALTEASDGSHTEL